MREIHLWRDLTYSLRILRRNPGFTATVVVTLGLGIGVCAAVFTMLGTLLLRPLPFPQPDRLVHVWGTDAGQGWNKQYVSPLDLEDMREAVPAFQHVAGFNVREYNLAGEGDQPEPVSGARVTAGVFEALGVSAAMGRTLDAGDERSGNAVVVISHGLWQRRFGGDPRVVGKNIVIHSRPHTVVGVMPASFVFPLPVSSLWVPAQLTPEQLKRENAALQIVARLRPGSTPGEAQGQLSALATTLAERYPDSHADAGYDVVPLREALTFAYDMIKLVSWIMAVAVGFALLLVCANVASLMLARFAARTQEVAIRQALGAEPRRLVSQFLVESLLLSLAGGALGLLVGQWLVRASAATVPDKIYRVGGYGLSLSTALFALGLAVLTALLVGLLPALRVVRAPVAQHLADGTRSTESRASRRRFDALVVSQLAVGCVLLIGALLMLRSVQRLQSVDPGFDTGVLSLKLILPKAKYPDDERMAAFVRDASARLEELPGVRSVAAVNFLPLNNETLRRTVQVEGKDFGGERKPSSILLYASAGYFEAMGVRLLSGRTIGEGDVASAPPVVVVNRAYARKFFPRGDPIGTRVSTSKPGDELQWRTVVGVVADYHHEDLKGAPQPQIFVPYAQDPVSYLRLLVRSDGDALGLVKPVRRAVAAIDPDLPLTEPRLLGEVVRDSLAPERFTSLALIGLGLGALLLAAIGLYGVMAFRVIRGTREIGVRLALGATPKSVLQMMLRQAGRLTLIGLAVGLVCASALSFGLSRMLFGVKPLDPMVYVAVAVMLASIALLASFLPVLRASRVDPMEALRHE
jgi:predicted permease